MSELTQYLIDILESHDMRHEPQSLERYFFKNLERKADLLEYVQEVYQELGGEADLASMKARPFDIELPTTGIYVDGPLDFNKYRAVTLRSDAYERIEHLDISSHLRLCRQYEKEALKSGIAGDLWHNKTAEKHFGISELPGDLGLRGSAAWKLRAMENLLGDLRALTSSVKVLRISLFDNLVLGGQMTQLRDLLKSRSNRNQELIGKFLKRKVTGAMMKYL